VVSNGDIDEDMETWYSPSTREIFVGILVECMLNYWKRVVVWDLYPKGYDYHIKWLMNKLASHPLVKIIDERIKTVKRYMRLSLKNNYLNFYVYDQRSKVLSHGKSTGYYMINQVWLDCK